MSDDPAEPDDDLEAMFADAVPDDIEYMFAQTSSGISVGSDGRVTMKGVSGTTLFFSDRPYRVTGHIPTDEFIGYWGQGDDSFANDPPNATLVTLEGDEFEDVVLELVEAPVLADGNLVFEVSIIEGLPPDAAGRSALFIDTIGRPMSPGSVAGVHRRHRRREVRRHTP